MPENPSPVLKRKRSVEEKRPEMFHSPVEHEEAQQQPAIEAFQRTMSTARIGAFLVSFFGLCLMIFSAANGTGIAQLIIGETLMIVASLGRIEKSIQVSCCLSIQRLQPKDHDSV